MKWFKLATRSYSIQKDQCFISGWVCNNAYHSLKNYFVIPLDGGTGEIYMVEHEWKKLMKVLAKEFYKDPAFFSKNLKKYKLLKNRVLKASRAIFSKDFKKYSSKKLFLLYKNLFDEIYGYCFFAYFPWALSSEIDPVFKSLLKKKFKKEWESVYNAVTAPAKHNEITLQLIKLLKMKIDGTLEEKLGRHIKQYQWLPVYDFSMDSWTKQDFLNQLKGIRNPKEELLRLKNEQRKNRQHFQSAIKKLKSDKKLLRMAELIHEYVWLRTDRIDVIRKALFYGQGFFRELEKRLGLKNKESVWMTKEEIKNFLLNNKTPDLKEINKRAKNNCMLYIRNKKQRLVSEPKEMKKIIEKELGIPRKLPKVFRGVAACKGIARGRVKIINSTNDISKMKKSSILVASMTLQEYMLAIRKAKAIITDEGGITCHATIVSRELGIPCIIGTKIATKALKDGDRVEVDANKGIVKILKRK